MRDIDSEFEMRYVKKSVQNYDHMTIIKIEVYDKNIKKVIHTVKHIHFRSWGDRDTPPDETLPELIHVLNEVATDLRN